MKRHEAVATGIQVAGAVGLTVGVSLLFGAWAWLAGGALLLLFGVALERRGGD